MKYILILVKNEYHKTPYDKWLSGSGVSPIIFVSDKFAEGYKHMDNVYVFDNYENNNLVEQKALEIGSKFRLIGLFTRAESDIIRAAKLREALKIQGQNPESALAFRNKVRMKDHLKYSGVNLPTYTLIESPDTVKWFSEKHGFPVVIKPVAESGSTGVTILYNEGEMNRFLGSVMNYSDLEVETFVEGQMYHIDGLVVNDEIIFIQPYKYVNDCLAYRKNTFLGGRSVSPNDKIYHDLIDTVKKVITHLPSPKNMAFHAEVWEKSNGELVFCEIASRPGGATVGLSIEYGFNFNIDKLWLLVECGLYNSFRGTFKYKPTGWLVIPPQGGVLVDMPLETSSSNCIKVSQYCGRIGDRFHGGVKSGLFLVGFAISGDSENEVEENIIQTAKWFADNSVWEISLQHS